MRRTARLDLERLEVKAMMSVVPSTPPGLASSLTAAVSKTPNGVRVVATLTETNVSDQDVSFSIGPGNDGFSASRHGQVVWRSNGGMVALYLRREVLKPHQSTTIPASWDGHLESSHSSILGEEGPQLAGRFAISDELDGGKATAIVTLPRGVGRALIRR